MQSPQDFIRDYLEEQVRLFELWSDGYKPMHKRFFQPDYNPFDPRQNIPRIKKEVILETSESDGTAIVTTSGYGDRHWMRYTLQTVQDGWRIRAVQMQCGICRGTGKFKEKSCKLCKGEGWKAF